MLAKQKQVAATKADSGLAAGCHAAIAGPAAEGQVFQLHQA